MRDHVTEDRISAYLDGELNLDERRLVEEQLAESEELRVLCEDLRRVRSQLQALPKVKLANDLASRVVQQLQHSAVSLPAAKVQLVRRKQSLSRWGSLAAMFASIAAVVVIAFSLPVAPEPPGPNPLDNNLAVTPIFLQQQPQLLMVYDVTISPAGAEANRFGDILQKAGVGYDPKMKLDGKLESDLLALRGSEFPAPQDTVAVPYKDRDLTIVPERVEMIYLTGGAATIGQVGTELKRLAAQRNEVRGIRFDLVLEPKQVEVLRRLHDSARLRFAQSGGNGRSDLGVAFGLQFSIQLTSTNVPEVASFALPRLDIQAAPTEVLGNGDSLSEAPTTLPVQAGAESGDELVSGSGTATGDNEPSAVLVILRYPLM